MRNSHEAVLGSPHGRRHLLGALLTLGACSCCFLLNGCTAITNPVANGLPARLAPPDFAPVKPLKDVRASIPLSLLSQDPPNPYRLDAGDTLAVWIEGVLGERNVIPPVHNPERSRLPPAVGFPILVSPSGTVDLPFVPPIPVAGLSLVEAKQKITDIYLKKGILQPNEARVLVSLMRPRQYHVVVMRQEASGFNVTSQGIIGGTKRGTGWEIDLPAYENDVLHALAQTGGLPGLDDYDEIIIHHRPKTQTPGKHPPGPADQNCLVTRIPLRMPSHVPLPFSPQDVKLAAGDVVFLEARDYDYYYTGGLLPAGQRILPRDTDLDVVEAVSLIVGPLLSSGLQGTGPVPAYGIGGPSPSLLIVLRRTAGGGQVPIRIDLNRALREPRERLLVQAGDILILQETPGEAVARYFTQNLFFNTVFKVFSNSTGAGSITLNQAPAIPFGTTGTAIAVQTPTAVTTTTVP